MSVSVGRGIAETSIIVGVRNGSNAPAGAVGEIISSTVGFGSAVSLTSTVGADVTFIDVTAGDWDVYGQACFITGATTVLSLLESGINTVSATLPQPGVSAARLRDEGSFSVGGDYNLGYMNVRISVVQDTRIFLVAKSTFTTSTNGAFGVLYARRAR